MPPRVKTPLEKVTLNLFEGDKTTLQSFFPAKGWSVAAREFLHDVCKRLRELDSQEVLSESELSKVEISLDDFDIS